MDINDVASICHEANRQYARVLGDTVHLPWDMCPEWQKKSVVAGVRVVLKNENVSAEELHASWMAQKVAEGWIWGPTKDPYKKQHPCLLPYDQLPDHERFKDQLFHAIAKKLSDQVEYDVQYDGKIG